MHSYLIRDNSSEHKGTERQPRQRQHKQAETSANKADTLELEVCWQISLIAKDKKTMQFEISFKFYSMYILLKEQFNYFVAELVVYGISQGERE